MVRMVKRMMIWIKMILKMSELTTFLSIFGTGKSELMNELGK